MRAQRRNEALLAYGFSGHDRNIFELRRLDGTITLHGSEPERWLPRTMTSAPTVWRSGFQTS